MRFRRVTRLGPSATTAAVAALVLAAAIAPLAGLAANRQGQGAKHLYVLDDYYKAVYRFPLAKDGMPAPQADGVLYPQGAITPSGLAVDRDGHVFVADSTANVIDEFAAGATGQQSPIATLNVGANQPNYLKFDASDRLFVHYGYDQSIAIFAKGAHGKSKPISIVPAYYSPQSSNDYVVTPDGSLLILMWAQGGSRIAIYNHPIKHPSKPDAFMWPQGGYEFVFWQTMALDERANRLYVEFNPEASSKWGRVDFASRPLPGSNGTPDDWLLTDQCGSSKWWGVGGSLVYQDYLFVSCSASGDVLVYDKRATGKQRAVATIAKGSYPWEIAVGP